MAPPSPVSVNLSGGSGLFQDFRKKINKYATPTTPVSSPRMSALPEPIRRQTVSPKVKTDLTHRIGRFEEHNALLQQLELQLTDMLAQLNNACRAMGSVVEVFTQTFRYDAASYRVGVDYLSAMKQMRRERAHLMEQAVRFTVLDPLASKLARHATLQGKIAEWRQLQRDVDKVEHKKWSDNIAKETQVGVLRGQLDELERELGGALDSATDISAVHQQVDLFTTMRLQLATFFYHTNHSLFSRLSKTEAEIVIGVGPSPRSPVAGAISTRTRHCETVVLQEDEVPEDDRDTCSSSVQESKTTPTVTGSSDDLDNHNTEDQLTSITLEEFGQGGMIPHSGCRTSSSRIDINRQQAAVPLPQLLALASHPVLETLQSDEDSTKPRQHGVRVGGGGGNANESSVFTVIRKSFNDKFNSPKGSDKGSRTGLTPLLSPSTPNIPTQKLYRRVIVTGDEWAGVEARLWAMDTSPEPKMTKPTQYSLDWVLQMDVVMFSLSGFLCIPTIGRLSSTSRRVYQCLRQCPAAWKRSIRLGGLTRPSRSAVWLSILYGGKPWAALNDPESANSTAVPHHLQSRTQRKQIYEGLLVKLGLRIADGLLQKSFDEDSEDTDTAKLVVWLREIDVDVVRTCSRPIYATKNATPAEALKSYRSLLEGTIRRVLRAYVMYNPRVGYCQGMNYLVRLLMEVCCGEADEADCFWLFVGLCEPENDRNLYEPGLVVLGPLFLRFEELLEIQKPQLHDHFKREGVPVASYTARWFLTFFSACETFDASVVIRILDAFAIDGWRVIFGMAMVVLDELEPQLLSAEMEEILRLLQSPRDRSKDRDLVEQIVRRGLWFSLPQRIELEVGKNIEVFH